MPEYKANIPPLEEFTSRLEADYDIILRDELRSKGYDPNPITEKDSLRIAYNTVFFRRIPSKPRRVHLPANFQIDPSVQVGFDDLVRKIEAGENLNPHLSRLSASLDSKDKLFFDWGITHFHLGTELDRDGFIRRTGPLAFAIVKEHDIYIIKIDRHGAWTKQEMIHIIDENWPELIAPYRIEGQFEQDFDDEQIQALRGSNINVGISLPNGHSYISLGGGIQTSGHSTKAVIVSNRLIHFLQEVYEDLHDKVRYVTDEEIENPDEIVITIGLKRVNNAVYLYAPDHDWQRLLLDFPGLPT